MKNVLAWLLKDKSGDPLLHFCRVLLVLEAISATVLTVFRRNLTEFIVVTVFGLTMVFVIWGVNKTIQSTRGALAMVGRVVAGILTISLAGFFLAILSYLLFGIPSGLGRILGPSDVGRPAQTLNTMLVFHGMVVEPLKVELKENEPYCGIPSRIAKHLNLSLNQAQEVVTYTLSANGEISLLKNCGDARTQAKVIVSNIPDPDEVKAALQSVPSGTNSSDNPGNSAKQVTGATKFDSPAGNFIGPTNSTKGSDNRPANIQIRESAFEAIDRRTNDSENPAYVWNDKMSDASRVVVLCIGCSSPFDALIHEKLVRELVANAYNGELRKALYLQDSLYQFASRAHFDNCDFDAAVAYIGSLLDEADNQVEQAKGFKARNDPASMQKAAKAAFFSIGQALHAVQDFYAHTNYVELSAAKAKSLDDIEIITPWNEKGKDAIAQLRRDGMISGFVFWGFPQLCPKGTPSHGDMAKDSESMPAGKVKIPALMNYSQHKIAMYLARESSKALLEHAFKRWPLLKELNGEAVVFDVLVDRRGN